MAAQSPHRSLLLPGLYPVLSALGQGRALLPDLRQHHADFGTLYLDFRRRKLHPVVLPAADPAVCGYALYQRGNSLSAAADRPQNLGAGTGALHRRGDHGLSAVRAAVHLVYLPVPQLSRQPMVRDSRHSRLFRRGAGRGAAGTGENAGAEPALRLHRVDLRADALVHAAANVPHAALQSSLRAARGRDRRAGLLALRLSPEPQNNSNDLSDPRRMDVQGQRGGGLALAAESGHLSHAQLRL